MQAVKVSGEAAQTSLDQAIALGKSLYSTNCQVCHGAIDSSAKKGRTISQIQTAINTIPNMAHLKILTWTQIEAISTALGGAAPAEICISQTDPGRVPIHRLNKDEYNRTVRKLLGITTSPGANLPDENTAFGFKNIAAILSVTPTSIDRYLEAAAQAVNDAFTTNAAATFNCNGQQMTAATVTRACAEQILYRVGEAAFRRPVTATERTQLAGFITAAQSESQSIAEGLRWGLEFILVSPSFLFRTIQHPAPNDPKTIKSLDGYELATRLAYMLWSAPPDQELKTLAANGTLTQSGVLETQVARMLNDPQAQALIDNFASQWLQLHKFEMHSIDTSVYSFSEALRQDMKTETGLLLRDVMFGGGSAMKLINDDSTYLNRRLAAHYGVSGPTSDTAFVRTSVANTERRGLLGHGSVLTFTSLPTRTSIVRRGKWILDNILCEPPAPPPPGVADGLPGNPGGNLKDQMAAHRNDPACASCHNTIDPIGFALEKFDANGVWRTSYRDGSAVDTAGTLPDGRPVAGAIDLSKILEADPRYKTCVTKKLMTYALGRGLEAKDQCTVNRLARDNVGAAQPFSSLVRGIVTSDPFRKQAGDGGN